MKVWLLRCLEAPRQQQGIVYGLEKQLRGAYWSDNLLWREGNLVAVLDCEDAALGDSLADVAGVVLGRF